jgi:hypothetical protein
VASLRLNPSSGLTWGWEAAAMMRVCGPVEKPTATELSAERATPLPCAMLSEVGDVDVETGVRGWIAGGETEAFNAGFEKSFRGNFPGDPPDSKGWRGLRLVFLFLFSFSFFFCFIYVGKSSISLVISNGRRRFIRKPMLLQTSSSHSLFKLLFHTLFHFFSMLHQEAPRYFQCLPDQINYSPVIPAQFLPLTIINNKLCDNYTPD